MSYLIVSNDRRVPTELENELYTFLSKNQFIEMANSDNGIDIESGLFYNIDSLDKDIYEALQEGIDTSIITFYKFEDQDIPLTFKVEEGIKVYKEETFEEEDDIEEEDVEDIDEEEDIIEEDVEEDIEEEIEEEDTQTIGDMGVLEVEATHADVNKLNEQNISNLLQIDEEDTKEKKNKNVAANVILFGSSKGGTGKTFTCLLSAYRYAQTHPYERVALADFDIVDGQIGIMIVKNTPTMANYYKSYVAGDRSFSSLQNNSVKCEHFGANLDFYLSPPMDYPEITNNADFWQNVFELLITNYDTVFFDSGIDYMGKEPISKLYRIADKIILTSNTSINSVKSIVRQLKTLSGERANNVFKPEDKILDRVNLVLTRVSKDQVTNELVVKNLTAHAPIVAAFGNIDELINRSQWYQEWTIWDNNPKILSYIDRIVDFGEEED